MTTNDEDLVLIKKSKLKSSLVSFLRVAYNFYIGTLKATTMFWRKLFKPDQKVLGFIHMRPLLEDPAIILFFNAVLFAAIGSVFLGTSGLLSQGLFWASGVSMLMFLFKVMGIIDRFLGEEAKEIEKGLDGTIDPNKNNTF